MTLMMQPRVRPVTQQDEIIPSSYVILAFTQRCQCCKAVHHWSETYALASLKSFWDTKSRVSNLHRIDQPKYDLPIEKRVMPEKLIPFCHSCNEPTLHDLPAPPVPPRQVLGLTEGSKPITKSTSTTPLKARPTLADLGELFK